MLVPEQTPAYPRRRLLIAGAVGLLVALLALFGIALPASALLAQFFHFSPSARIVLLVKLLSPLLCFFLAGGWVWVLLWVGSMMFSRPIERSGEVAQSVSQTADPLKRSISPQESSLWGVEEERPIGIPPLFQLDPENPVLPVTPIPTMNLQWTPNLDLEKSEDESIPDAETNRKEDMSSTQAEQIVPSMMTDSPFLRQEGEGKLVSRTAKTMEDFFLRRSDESSEADKPVTIALLKRVRVWLRAQDGTQVEVKLRGGENSIRLIIFAYIAWKLGKPVDRDKLLTHVIARGKRQNMDVNQLGEVFDAAKKYLRQDLDRAVNELERAGHIVGVDVDFFSNEPGFYWLNASCRVVDLEQIEQYNQTLHVARKEGLLDEKLDGSLPPWVREACQKLIDAYTGDFLQVLLEKFPDEFGIWVREPFTLYRDRYLDALLVMANYESALGRNFFDEKLTAEQNEEQRRSHSAKAAQLFHEYAMYAVNSIWDRKLKFAYRAGKDGERVIMAARAIRRCVVELGKLGRPDMIDQVYLAFKERMSKLSDGTWKPDKDTENDVADAKKTTSAYRFSSQIAATQQERMRN